jgi:small subunit ribosomal protein S16
MVRIRLRMVGSRHQPSFRLVAIDREAPRDGRPLEQLGQYNPRTEPSTITIDEARMLHWLSKGAQPSESVTKLLTQVGTLARYERLKKGESLETLVAEAGAAQTARVISPLTRRVAKPTRISKKVKAAKAAEAAGAPKAE